MSKKINLGSGRVFLKDSSGNVNEVGYLRDVSLDYSATEKEFYGSNTFPEDVGLVSEKLTGKAAFGGFDGGLIASLLGATVAANHVEPVTETATAAASVTVTGSANFAADLGVLDKDGVAMTKVGATPAVGQYTVAAGVYGFNASETGTLTFSYTKTVTGGKTATYSGRTIGASPKFEVHVYETARDGKAFGYKLFAVTFSKIGFGFKSQDFTESNIEFACARDAAGKVFEQYTA